MKAETTKSFGRPVADLKPPLNIVLTFNDPEIATFERKLLNKLFFKTTNDLDIHFDEWMIDKLEHPHCLAEALALAHDSDIFVVAASAISESFVEFVNEWLNSKRSSDAALILIQYATICPASAQFGCLRRLADDAGVACFSTGLCTSRSLTSHKPSSGLLSISCTAPETSPINE